MLYDVIGYDNQVIGQVDAGDSIEAWAKAGLEYSNVLDVRLAIPPDLIADLREGAEYEGRFWFGSFSYTRFRFAEKDAPIRKMIPMARDNYNALREKLGFAPITDWTKRPDDTLEKRLRELL